MNGVPRKDETVPAESPDPEIINTGGNPHFSIGLTILFLILGVNVIGGIGSGAPSSVTTPQEDVRKLESQAAEITELRELILDLQDRIITLEEKENGQ